MTDLTAAVLGAAGYAGGELLRLLADHPDVGALRAFSASHAGKPLSEAHPALRHLGDGTFEEPDPAGAAAWADVLFLALPHGRSQELMGEILARDPRLVVDVAADFRVQDAALAEPHYGPHTAPELRPRFVYALADLAGDGLAGQRCLAVPGCFATAALLALHPFAAEGLLAAPPVVFAATGSTGSGAQPKPGTHHPARANSFRAYATAGHRHEAEITEALLRAGASPEAAAARLLPHSAPLVRGIHATAHLRLARPVPDPNALLAAAWEGRPFVHVLEAPPALAPVVGTNFAHLHATPRAGGREAVVNVVIDNLVKGTAGQAVQAMNLALGLEETAGLRFPGLAPC